MYKFLTLFAALSTAIVAQQTTCRAQTLGPAIGGLCPTGYTVISNGECCSSSQVTSSASTCVDKTNANGVNECPGTPSSSCVDLTNPNTGRSECAANQNLCNNSLYEETMKTQCPKTCGYCK
ncbi:hypothetical protein CRE_06440 [Caenorhabditis remanei]|uniref:ShKT domain-containing protein n=1 Tax=Caenorhabditis remanei TaxID=31234 RepID=E3M0Y1_CAERE|nr:hypothetical protein CRE_06440 [Caenorhabditis remanei]